MLTSASFMALATMSLFGQVLVGGDHRFHQHLYKKDPVAEADCCVTASQHEDHIKKTSSATATRSPSCEESFPAPSTDPAAAPTSFTTSPEPVPRVAAAPEPDPKVSEDQAAPPPTDPAPPGLVPNDRGGGSGKVQRGLAYNDANMLPGFLGSNSKITWTYNWGQEDNSNIGLEFVPMLWGTRLDDVRDWDAHAAKAVKAGSTALLSFNEPDIGTQANMPPTLTAKEHIRLMNPWASKARIGSPSISSSTSKNMGIDWMKQFFAACAGKCEVDFIAAHCYDHDAKGLLAHLLIVHAAFNLPVWVTEFRFPGDEDDINREMVYVINELDTNPKYSFVERYAYFMAAEGSMVSGKAPNKYGRTFAFSS